MTPTTTSVFEAISEIAMLPAKLFRLTAIHNVPRFRYSLGWATTLRAGMMIRIVCDALVDITDELPPTHTIMECRGTLYDSKFEVDCELIGGEELITIKL